MSVIIQRGIYLLRKDILGLRHTDHGYRRNTATNPGHKIIFREVEQWQ